MSEGVASTWSARELPILRSALRRFDAGELLIEFEDVRQETGLSVSQFQAGVQALATAYPPYLEISLQGGWTDDHASGLIEGISETRRELGSWPSPENLVAQLVTALTEAADREPEPEQKSRLRAAAEALGGVAREVAVGVVSDRLGRLGG